MLNRQLPIIMGRGTKLVSQYKTKTFPTGRTIVIMNSKTKFTPGHTVTEQEFMDANPTIAAEIHFTNVGTFSSFVKTLEKYRDDWIKEENKQ